MPRPAASHIAAALTAAALTLATCLPSEAATSTAWQVAFRGHFGSADMGNDLLAVAAASTTSAWAVGGTETSGNSNVSPVVLQWNGTKWQASALPSGLAGTLSAVSAPASDDVWAGSLINGYLLHGDGTAWSVAKKWPASQSGQITGITAFSPSNVWVFGASGAFAGLGTWHLSGGTWHKSTGLANTISGASALSPADMWAIGAQHQLNDTLVHYNGTTWQPVTSPALSGLAFGDILAISDSNIWATAAGSNRKPELVHFDGRQWQTVPVTVPKPVTELGAIAPGGHGGLWFAGFSASAQPPRAVHRSASGAWSASKLSAGVGDVEGLARIPGTTSLWAAGGLEKTSGADAVIWGHGPGT
jgi:hypothetical protein